MNCRHNRRWSRTDRCEFRPCYFRPRKFLLAATPTVRKWPLKWNLPISPCLLLLQPISAHCSLWYNDFTSCTIISLLSYLNFKIFNNSFNSSQKGVVVTHVTHVGKEGNLFGFFMGRRLDVFVCRFDRVLSYGTHCIQVKARLIYIITPRGSTSLLFNAVGWFPEMCGYIIISPFLFLV